MKYILSFHHHRHRRHQVPGGPTGEEDEQVAAAAMKQLEMLVPNFSGANCADG